MDIILLFHCHLQHYYYSRTIQPGTEKLQLSISEMETSQSPILTNIELLNFSIGVLILFIYLPCHSACGILAPPPGIESQVP